MGAGILSDYGSIVDEAQSLSGTLFDPESRSQFIRFNGDNFSLMQDLRAALFERTSDDVQNGARFRYANFLKSGAFSLYSEHFFRTEDEASSSAWIDKALIQASLSERDDGSRQLQFGEDYQPSGLGNGVRRPILKAGKKKVLSAHDNLQLKYYDWSSKYLLSVQAFNPRITNRGEDELADTQGVGAFYEHYPQRDLALGGSSAIFRLKETDDNSNFLSLAAHCRVGFGDKAFAALLETSHVRGVSDDAESDYQNSGTFQLFYYFREYLLPGVSFSFLDSPKQSKQNEDLLSVNLYFRYSRNVSITLSHEFDFHESDYDNTSLEIAAKF